MALRAFGPYNGTLPVPTGIVQGFMRDPKQMPFLRYCKYVGAPEVQYSWWRLDPDEPARLVDPNQFAWAYDDYRPTGKGFQPRAEMLPGRIKRWDFPYTIGDQTTATWKRSGVDPKQLLDRIRMNHAMLHRATRVVSTLQSGLTGAQTSTLAALLSYLNIAPGYLDQASGQEMMGGTPNPLFQLVQKVFGEIKRRIHLVTNGAVTSEELIAVVPPKVALKLSYTGEMFEALKQSNAAPGLVNPNLARGWRLPPEYGGFTIVVEDTPRCFINMAADGTTVADVTVASQKDYIMSDDSIYFTCRTEGLDGGYGYRDFNTITCFTLNGEAQVEAFSEPKHKLTEGHIVLEDDIQMVAPISGFRLTSVLAP